MVDQNKRVKETEAAQKLTETLERWLGESQTPELSQEMEEQLKKFSVGPAFVDWFKGLLRRRSHSELRQYVHV